MTSSLLVLTALCLGPTEAPRPGDYTRPLESGGLKRKYLVHVPSSYDHAQATPLVLALHGLSMNAPIMAWFTGLNKVADREGFIIVYPDGTGPIDILRGWNAGAFPGDSAKERPDDVAFLKKVLDDAESILNVDTRRIYVAGMSNGAMMTHRFAAACPERIAAVAPVAGTMPEDCEPKRPVPVLHFHGTADTLVPFDGFKNDLANLVRVKSVEDTIRTWVKINGCQAEPIISEIPARRDKLQVIRKEYPNRPGAAEVILYVLEGGGHVWPGMHLHPPFLGPGTDNVNANDVMWEFFKAHQLKR
jgi:polyhydroxybutyrate depolymerase